MDTEPGDKAAVDPRNRIVVWLIGVAATAFITGLSAIRAFNDYYHLTTVPIEEHEQYRRQQEVIDHLNKAAAQRDNLESEYGILPLKRHGWAPMFHVSMSDPGWSDLVDQYLRNGPPLGGIRGALSGNDDIYLWAEAGNSKVHWTIRCQRVVNGDWAWSKVEFRQKVMAGAVPIGIADRTGEHWREAPGNPEPHGLCLWYLEPTSLSDESQSKSAPPGQN